MDTQSTVGTTRRNLTLPAFLALGALALVALPWYGERVDGSALELAFGTGRWWLAPLVLGWMIVLAGWLLPVTSILRGRVLTAGALFGMDGPVAQAKWLEWVDDDFMVLQEAGFEVRPDDILRDWISHADSLDVQLQPHGEQDHADGEEAATSPWFDLSLGMEIDGVRHNMHIAVAQCRPVVRILASFGLVLGLERLH